MPAVKGMLKPFGSKVIINPPYSLEDLEQIRQHAFVNEIGADQLRTAFEDWGGVPRIVFSVAMDPNKREQLLDELSSIQDFADLFLQAGQTQIAVPHASGLHFHLTPGQRVPPDVDEATDPRVKFMYPAYCWGSLMIEEKSWDELKLRHGEIPLLKFMEDCYNAGAARGLAFEPYVIRTLETGNLHGRVKLLTGGSVEKSRQILPALKHQHFETWTPPPTCAPQHFLLPLQRNHTDLDFYWPGEGLMFQITVGKKHGIKWAGVEAAIASGVFDKWIKDNKRNNVPPALRLAFICDHNNYNEFKYQPWLDTAGHVFSKDSANQKDGKVVQYAMEWNVRAQLDIRTKKSMAAAQDTNARKNSKAWGIDDLK